MKNLVILFLTAIAITFAGCSSTLPINYVPAATMRGSGEVSVGEFRYLPSDQGKVAPDQFQKASSAIGKISLSLPVSDLFKLAIRKELVASGFSVESGSAILIEGDVERFLYDWIGYIEVDFFVDVNFRIIKDGNVVLTYRTTSHQKAPKTMTQDTEAVRAAISDCIDQLFLEARSKKLL